MKIVVLVKQVPDTWGDRKIDRSTGRVDRSAGDSVIDEVGERALEVALRYKDDHEAEVVVLTMGPAGAVDVLRKALAMGADSAIHVLDDSLVGSDIYRTAEVLSAVLRRAGSDLVIAGNESTDGRGGVVPAMIAEHLRLPHATFLNTVEIGPEVVRGERGTESGAMAVHADLPAVISVTERAPEARFASFMGIRKARKKPLEVLAAGDLGVATERPGGLSSVLSSAERPPRTGGRKIVDDGNAADELAKFLADGHLI